jgi:anti-sigma regulatory factor (Ser/Thr protein kinase)
VADESLALLEACLLAYRSGEKRIVSAVRRWSDNTPMTPSSDVRCFEARMGALPQVLACVREACRQAGFAPGPTLRVELALEELFTNTVQHGYGGDCDRPVWLETACVPDELCVIYQDAAKPFDPFACEPSIQERPPGRPGGEGIKLIVSLANRIGYARKGERNVLTLVFRVAST